MRAGATNPAWLIANGARLGLLVALWLVMGPVTHVFQVQDWIQAGDQAAQQGDPATAATHYQRAALRAGEPSLAERLSHTSRQAPQTADAQRVYLLADVEASGWTPALRREYARLLNPQRDLAALRYLIGEVDQLQVGDVPLLWALFEDERRQHNWAAARTSLQKILALTPDDPRANYQLGLLLAQDNPTAAEGYLALAAQDARYSLAAQRVRQLLATLAEGDAGTRYRSLGALLVELGAWPYAERAFSAALALDNLDWFSYAYRGYVRDQQGNDGFRDLETAVALAPRTALPYYFMGLHWRSTTPPALDEAHAAFAQAYLIEPDNPAHALEIAQTFQLQNQLELARDWYAIAASNAPDDPTVARLQAAFYADTDYALDDEGFALIQAAQRLAPDDPHILTSLGRAHYLREELDEARRYLQEASRLAPDSARTRYYLGVVLQAQGDSVAAALQFERAVQAAGPEAHFGQLAARTLARLER